MMSNYDDCILKFESSLLLLLNKLEGSYFVVVNMY